LAAEDTFGSTGPIRPIFPEFYGHPHRLAPRLGKKKAIVALEHSILTAVWHMLTHDVDYHDLGGDYFTRRDPTRAMKKIIRQANALGFTVRFEAIPAA
jgi:transposase